MACTSCSISCSIERAEAKSQGERDGSSGKDKMIKSDSCG